MPVTVNRREAVYRGRVFLLLKENVTLENGITTDLEYLEHPGAAAVVPVLATGEVVLIRQYRHALGQFIWEIPAGTLDPREAIMDCARRELVEETGYDAAAWHPLGDITPVPGYSDERIHLFLATGLTPARQHLDADEVLDVHRVPMAEAIAMIEEGKIKDAKSICGLLLAHKRLERQKMPQRGS
jgi:ADP-ribose pyrophosphatase